MPKIRPFVESPFLVAVTLALALGCTRCGGGSKSTAGDQRPPHCRDVGSTVNICADDTNRASVDGATAAPAEPAGGLR